MPHSKSAQKSLELIKDDTSKVLGLKFGTHDVTPALYIPKAEAQLPPTLSFSALSPSKTYIAICLDLDPPFASLAILGPALHWIQSGYKVVADGTLSSSEPAIAFYAGPAPPPIGSPHRYVFFLYEQPDSFDAGKYIPADGKPMGIWPRMRFDWDKWEKEAGLGEVVAVNYFTSN